MKNIEMIFGAPGTGKTTFLMDLLEDLLKKYNPNEIAFVSFTKKGSYEGRDRAIQRFNFSKEDFPYFKTLHAIAFKELSCSRYDMISKRHYKDFSKAMGMNFLGYYTEDLMNNDDKYLSAISLKRNNPIAYEKSIKDMDQLKLAFIEQNYIRFKKEIGVLDFDDLLINCIKKDIHLPIKIAIIDEAQDLTTLQWNFCKMAFADCEKIYIAGDDDQAIYEWSGSDIKQFLGLTKESSVKILDQSFRLKDDILNFSKQISYKIKNRIDKKFRGISKGGGIYFHNSLEDITINSEESWYFLNRNNYYLPVYKNYIMKKGIPFSYKGEPYIKPAIYQAIIKYEHLRQSKKAEKINTVIDLKRFLKKDVQNFPVWYEAFDLIIEDQAYYRDLFKNKIDINRNKINISTIHGVKGGEADNVVLMLDITKNVFLNIEQNLDSELRCLYVACTRAKKNLNIIYSNSKFGYEELLNDQK